MSYNELSREELIAEIQGLKSGFDQLKKSCEKDILLRVKVEEELLKRTNLLSAFKKYSIELEEQENDKIQQFIVTSFKSLFNVRVVWFSSYNEKKSELIIETSTATEEESSLILRYMGLAIKKHQNAISEEQYRMMVESGTKVFSSLHEISFGQIPKLAGLAIEKLFDVGWFQGVALTNKGKLYGTLVIGGYKGQEELPGDVVKIFSDLTSNIMRRKEVESNLQASEDKFRKAFITSPDSININRLNDGMYVLINSGFTKITGYTEAEIIGKTSVELNIWGDSSERQKLIKELSENGEVENMETRFRMKNGFLRIGIMSAKIIDLDGVPHILSITRDVTERKRMEIELRDSETRFRELIELAPDGILLGSHNGTIQGANSRMLSITGRTLTELIGLNISSLFSDHDLDSFHFKNDLPEKDETVSSIRNIKRPDGSSLIIEMHTKMMPDGSYQSIWHDITKRKLVEEALLKSKEQYDDLVSKIPVGIYILRSFPEGTFALDYMSPRMAEMLDSSVEELLSAAINIYDKIYPDDKDSFIKLNLDGIKYRQPFDWSGRVKYKGTIKWLHISSAPELQKNGDILWHGIVVDITEQKQAEYSLIESERLLRESQNIARLGSFIWDLASGLWKSSGILDEIFGIDENYIRSFDGWANIVHPDFRTVMTDYATKEVIGKHHKFDKEYRIIRHMSGQARWVHGLGELEFDNNSKPIKLIGSIIDITDRKEAEEEIQKISKHYQALIEKAPDGIIQLDAAGNFKYGSPSARKMFGYSDSEKITLNPTEKIHADDLPKVLSELEKLLKDPAYIPTLQYRFSDTKGNWLWVESTFSNLLDDPSVESIVINFRDITDRKKVEDEVNLLNIGLEERVNERTAQLEEANNELQAFAYSVSHDLRAPLRAIDGFSKFVLEDYGNKLDTEGQRLLGLIRSNTQKMDKLITDILSLSRVTRSEHRKSRIDMTKMAMSMISEAASPEMQKKLVFTVDPLPLTYADPTFIKQVWINLISNAIKFSSLNMIPEIKIGGYRENKYNVYYISDNGVGFNPEYAHKLFGVFQRLHKASEFEGTGVGLAIVQRIIHRHGGKVWAESKEGRGATFYFSLPSSE